MTEHMIEVAKRNSYRNESELRKYLKGAFWSDNEIEQICKYVNKYLRKGQ